jgi:hypothetical protein
MRSRPRHVFRKQQHVVAGRQAMASSPVPYSLLIVPHIECVGEGQALKPILVLTATRARDKVVVLASVVSKERP